MDSETQITNSSTVYRIVWILLICTICLSGAVIYLFLHQRSVKAEISSLEKNYLDSKVVNIFDEKLPGLSTQITEEVIDQIKDDAKSGGSLSDILKGEQGLQGDKGETGNTGLPGSTGAQGEPGAEGPQGEQGPKGDTGDSFWTDSGTYIFSSTSGDYGDSGARITDEGNILADGSLTIDGSASMGATTLSSLNLSAGGITNTGAVAGVSSLSASGAITAATTTDTINGLVINAGSITTGTWAGSAIGLGSGGTGSALSDPGGDRLLFWDDSAGNSSWLTPGSNLSITDTTLNATDTDTNNYPTEMSFSGTTTKTLTLKRNGLADITASFTDLDTGSITASNGLTLSAGDIKLGGTLSQATTVVQGNNNMTFNLNGTGDLDIQDNGNTVLFVKDDALVGIGTNDPKGKLNIVGTADDEQLIIQANGTQTADILKVFKSDGTTQIVGLEADGTIHFESDATTYDDVLTPGFAVKPGAASPDLVNFAGSTTVQFYGFDGTVTQEDIFFSVQLPHTYKTESTIYPHVHWAPSAASDGTKAIRWKFEYTWQSLGGTFTNPSSNTIYATTTVNATAWTHQLSSFTSITGTGKGISSILVGHLYRDPGDAADTYESDAVMLGFDIHIEQDTLGSRSEFTK